MDEDLSVREMIDVLTAGIYKSAKLTRNGQSSLILTLPNDFWQAAGIEHEDPGSVGMYYFEDDEMVVMDLGQRR